jgi:hypothetical protein
MINFLKQYVWQLLIVIVVAMAYSFLYGLPIKLPLWFIILDGCIYAASLLLLIVAIGIAMKYSLTLAVERGGRVCYLLALGFLTCIFLLGIESLTAYVSSEKIFILFKENIQQRLFTDVLLCVIIILNNRLYNDQQNRERENDIEISSPTPYGLPSINISSEDTNSVIPSVCCSDDLDTKDLSDDQVTDNINTKQKKNTPITQVSVKIGQKIRIIQVAEIISIKADGDYVSICTSDGTYLKEQTMKYYEENLPQTDFLRIHRSYIVRLSDILRIERYGQIQQVEMRSGEKIRISANGYKLLRSTLGL